MNEYAATDYVSTLEGATILVSMASVGCPEENGYAERLMRTIKEEEVSLTEYEDYRDACRQIGRFLEDVYQTKRIHSSLGYLTPAEFEEGWHTQRDGGKKQMAVWQYDLELLPRTKIIEVCGSVPERLENDLDAATDWWRGVEIPSDYPQTLGSFMDMSQKPSWSRDLITWGDEDGDCIDVFTEEGEVAEVAEVAVRVDARLLDRRFLEGVTNFARHYDCVILTEDMALLEPDVDLLYEAVQHSRAMWFVEDPRGFLDALSQEKL